MRNETITISKEVDIEIDLSDVLDEFSLDQLLQNTSADEVLDTYESYEVIDWAVSNLDISDLLDGIKNSVNADEMTEWLKSNEDMLPANVEAEEEEEKKEEPKPEPTPLKHPFVSMTEGRILVDGKDVGTYKVFGGVIAVDAFNVQFMANTLDNASKIMNAIAFASVNLSEV
jgi:ATP-dependent helicase YprA (DUF1998 family)